MFTLIDPKVWAVLIILTASAFVGGYATKAHYAAIEVAEAQARQKTIVQTVEKVVQVSDTRRIQVLTAKLKKSQAQTSALQKMIAEEAHEKPAPVECRISERLLNDINRQLSDAPE